MFRLLLCLLFVVCALPGGEAPRSAFFNQRVSARSLALNQPVRLEFTTGPRQIESVNIEAAVADAILVGYARQWRLVGRPAVQIDEKTRTVRVSLVLQPRTTGQANLPAIPVSWLTGDQIAEFGQVTVESQVLIGGELRPIPGEVQGVGGFAWGAALAELAPQLGQTTVEGDRTLARPKPGLTLIFYRGKLAEAQIDTPDVALEAARPSFLARWGSPLSEDANGLLWVIGWTRIAASKLERGVRVSLVREDLFDRAVQERIADQVFRYFEAPAPAQP
ncbi:MAG: hypothetical protein RMM29_01245 [Planctomycetota bacterium]|nr:hypothetical protein [Planctomycetota bacterium]MDW8372261.1 hypothetical protein [Planctomycetota bacterium]